MSAAQSSIKVSTSCTVSVSRLPSYLKRFFPDVVSSLFYIMINAGSISFFNPMCLIMLSCHSPAPLPVVTNMKSF